MEKEEIIKQIAKHYHEVIPESRHLILQRSDQFKDLGANSMDRAEIINLVMESLSLDMPRVELFGTRNIGELVDLLYEKIKKK